MHIVDEEESHIPTCIFKLLLINLFFVTELAHTFRTKKKNEPSKVLLRIFLSAENGISTELT